MKSILEIYVSKLSLMAITFLANIIIARQLGPDGVGSYAVVMATSILLYSVLSFGLDASLIYYSSRNPKSLKNLITISVTYSAIVVSIAGAALSIASFYGIYSSPDSAYMLSAMTATLLQSFVISIKIGQGSLSLVNKWLIITNLLSLALIIIISRVSVLNYHDAIVIYSFSCITFSVTAITLELLKNKNKVTDKIHIKTLFSYSLRSYLGNLSGTLRIRLPIIIISAHLTLHETGIYSAAQTLTESFYVLPVILGSLLISKLPHQTTTGKVTTTIQHAKLAFVTSTVSIVTFNLASEYIIMAAYGISFQPAQKIALILSCSVIFYSTTKVLSSYFMGIGKPEINSILELLALTLCTALLLYLTPKYGLAGAAYSVLISFLTMFLMTVFLFKKITKAKIINLFIVSNHDIRLAKDFIFGKLR